MRKWKRDFPRVPRFHPIRAGTDKDFEAERFVRSSPSHLNTIPWRVILSSATIAFKEILIFIFPSRQSTADESFLRGSIYYLCEMLHIGNLNLMDHTTETERLVDIHEIRYLLVDIHLYLCLNSNKSAFPNSLIPFRFDTGEP